MSSLSKHGDFIHQRHHNYSTLAYYLGSSIHGGRCHGTFQATLLLWPCIHFGNRKLFLKIGWSHSFKRSGGKI